MNQTEIVERNPRSLAIMTHSCSRIKADYVVRDEHDLLGVRAALNLGHTVGHALEKMSAYKNLGHGEAVAIGLVCALSLSLKMKLLAETAFQRALRLLQLYGLPMLLPAEADPDAIIDLMRRDKKSDGGLSMVLLRGLGDPHLDNNINSGLLRDVLERCKKPLLF